MKKAFFYLLCCSATLSSAWSENDVYSDALITSETAVVCGNPFKLDEAIKAISDDAWLKEIGCAVFKQGLKATKIGPESLLGLNPIEARLYLEDGSSLTVWGKPYAFTFPDGQKLPR